MYLLIPPIYTNQKAAASCGELTQEIKMKEINQGYPCPCCGCLTLSEPERGTFEICPVCFWEDDDLQFNNPEFFGGANQISLNKARKNYKEFGASSKEFLNHVKIPFSHEMP